MWNGTFHGESHRIGQCRWNGGGMQVECRWNGIVLEMLPGVDNNASGMDFSWVVTQDWIKNAAGMEFCLGC